MPPQLGEDLREVRDEIAGLFRFDHNVVNIHLDDVPYKLPDEATTSTSTPATPSPTPTPAAPSSTPPSGPISGLVQES
jgi:hypothetical protein